MVKKRPLRSLREFLQGIPKIENFIEVTVPYSAQPDDCCELRIEFRRDAYEAKRKAYFRRYPFWYRLAKLLNRKEVR